MTANHFLDTTGDGLMRLAGRADDPGPHCLELFETGGEMFLRLTLAADSARGPGPRLITLPLTADDARQLRDGFDSLLGRLGLS